MPTLYSSKTVGIEKEPRQTDEKEKNNEEEMQGGLNILINTFCVCAVGFQGLSNAFHYPIHYNYNFLFASLKLLTNFENAS